MDMVGPLPPTEEGHRFILTVCDYGSRYPEAFPLKSTTSQDVAEALVEMFSHTGIPEEILTDRGTNFCSELMEEFLKMFGVCHIKTSAYHPETDSMVERYNATLKHGLRKYVDQFQGQWNKAIPYHLFAFRELPHTATGLSPFELIYGHNPRGPLNVLEEEWVEPTRAKESTISHLLEVYRRLEMARAVADCTEKQNKADMKDAYDHGTRTRSIEVDDLVLVLLPTVSNKLLARWQGPFPVLEKVGSTTYKVQTGNNTRGIKTFHINMLSRWESPSAVCLIGQQSNYQETSEIPSWTEESSETEFHINKELSPEQQNEMTILLERHQQTFSNRPGRTTAEEICIDTGEARPISSTLYRLPQTRLEAAKREVSELLREGLIRTSRSPWASLIVLVPKKDG